MISITIKLGIYYQSIGVLFYIFSKHFIYSVSILYIQEAITALDSLFNWSLKNTTFIFKNG